ncbi:alpha/beta family hydrolase [Azotobacter chroococcum]|uniref:alpha/beta family hydrolase n=1 Tax=Azotobacter chroococcum TaxID=353 RepID=UPI001F604C29|nr:alpha/beta family hydrolase [Azotobacter chroococcum]
MVNGQVVCIDVDQCPQDANGIGAWLWSGPSPAAADACLILAHGAGAPMDSEFMTGMAERLAVRGVAVVRFEFPYMAARRRGAGRRPPDPQDRLLDCWRETYSLLRQRISTPLAIGGKSMGGRMASLLADELGVDALVCLGYPFHPAGKTDKPRTAHLAGIRTPTLIVQGERDAMGKRDTVMGYSLSAAICLHWLASADHDLKPLRASGFTHEHHLDMAADAVAKFLQSSARCSLISF